MQVRFNASMDHACHPEQSAGPPARATLCKQNWSNARGNVRSFAVCAAQDDKRVSSFSWILSNPPLLKTATTSFGRSIGTIRSTIASAFCS